MPPRDFGHDNPAIGGGLFEITYLRGNALSRSNRKSVSLLLRLLALLATFMLVAAACGGGGDDDEGTGGGQTDGGNAEDEGEPQAGGTVTIGLEAESQGWRPCLDSNGSTPGEVVMNSLYDSYMVQSTEGDIKPYLAQSIESNDDFTEWTMKLREGVKFHDGTPLDAEAAKKSWDEGTNGATSNCKSVAAPVKEVQIVDDLTLKFVMKEPYGPFPSVLVGSSGRPMAPSSIANGADKPVGTGPFTFVSWQRDNQLQVKKNPDYWQTGKPYLDGITFKPIPDENTRLAAVQSGEVDIMHSLRQAIVAEARDLGDEFEKYEFIGNNAGGSIINTKKAPVDDKRVRQALAYALNQEELIAVLGGEGISPPATQFFSEDSPWYSKKVAEGWPQNDPEKAKELLDEYKNDPERSDGKKPGDPVEVTFACPPDPSLIEVAQAYQAQAQAVGFKMELRQFEQATHIQNALKDDFMINCWRMGSQNDPDSEFFTGFATVEGNPLNFTNFTTPEIQKLLKEQRATGDFEKRKAIFEKIMLILNEEVPLLWTGHTATVVVAKAEVNGIETEVGPDGVNISGIENSELRPVGIWRES